MAATTKQKYTQSTPLLLTTQIKRMNYDRGAISLWVLASKLEARGRRVKVNVIS